MRTRTMTVLALASTLGVATAARAAMIGVTTNASATVNLPSTTATAGPFPFGALGVKASATYTPGPIDASVGGGTTFNFPTVSQGAFFTPADKLSVGYDPFWVGTVRATSGLDARADLQWNIGPFSGSHTILHEQVDPTATGSVAFGGTLQGGAASDTDLTNKYGVSFNFVNPFPVFTEASLGATVQGRLTQGLTWAPTAEYGFWSWADTDGIYDASDALTWHGVTSGPLDYGFGGLVAPGSSPFYLNFIPGVTLEMPVGFDSTFGIDVNGFALAKVFGFTVAEEHFPLGTATWQLASTSYLFDPWWYAGETFSIPLVSELACDPATGLCSGGYRVPAQTVMRVQSGPPSGGPRGLLSVPAPRFLPSSGFTDVTTGGFCVGDTCYSGIDDDRLGDPGGDPTVDISVTPVPEPGSLLLLGSGLVGVAGRRLRRRFARAHVAFARLARTRSLGVLAGAAALGLAALAGAADAPKLKVFGDTPSEKGKWRFEITKATGGGGAMAGHPMTFCMDAAQQMAEEARKNGGAQGCTFKVTEDAPTRAAFESSCPGMTMRSTIQREGPKTFLFSVTSSGKEGLSMEGRYSYEGPCSADSAVVGFDKNSKECQQAKASLAALDPVKACGSLQGAQRKTCEDAIASTRKQYAGLCQ